MKKTLLFTLGFTLVSVLSFSQTDRFWSVNTQSRSNITTDKAVTRLAYPKEFKLFNVNLESLKQQAFTAVGINAKQSTIISLPNADGALEQFEIFEASNFEPALQARFPEIRAFSGRGITDRSATLKLSVSPQGVQTMVFRTEKENEFMEPYSKDHSVYAVYKSQRDKTKIQWTCSTEDQNLITDLNGKVNNPTPNVTGSSTGELKTMRLAQSCNGEYSNYFGAFNSSQVALVLAAFNATLTRCNGCYEKDLALHLNLIPTTTAVIYYDPATDPYTGLSSWNGQLQTALTANIGEANYDIGHMFGASGGGGNAGCIGCVCVDGQKGRGITSPADGIPMGDNFDIDYVVHEVGHQLGGNHTFSHGLEGSGQNKEVGSGITIMGYAGITSYDVAPHSIDIYHETTIGQIQANLAIKTCPVTTNITATNATPVVAPVASYTIPISTAFILTGSATDANSGDVLTYCWEQNDNATTSGAASVASPTKATGPNWLSFSPTVSSTRMFPKLSTVLAGLQVTPPLPGGDPVANIEALSSISRTLNFRLTVRDNHPYTSTVPVAVGQTAFTDMTVTVSSAAGPFQVTAPNTAALWCGGSTQTITWDVNATNAAPVNCANVKISLSTDGGLTFPTVLAASTANDGSEALLLPNTPTTTARIKIEAIGNIFFDISNTNFEITAATPVVINTQPNSAIICSGIATTSFTIAATGAGLTYQWQESTNNGGSWNNVSNGGVYSGATTTTLTLTNAVSGMSGYQYRAIASTGASCGSSTSAMATLTVNTLPAITAQPAASTICTGSNASFSSAATGTGISYQWQVSTTGAGGPWANITNGGVYSGATTATLVLTGATVAMNSYQYRAVVTGTCAPAATSGNGVLTVIAPATVTAQPAATTTICSTGNTSFTVAGSSTAALIYQWQVSTDAGVTWTPVNNTAPYSGATTATLTITNVPTAFTGYRYRALLSNASCTTPATSNSSILTVNVLPTAAIASTLTEILAGQTTVITATTTPTTGLSIAWYKDNVLIQGATSNTYTVDVNKLGVYKVVVTDLATGTCINQSNLLDIKALPSDRLFVYPSPNDGKFTVTYFNAGTTATTQGITIYDGYGRKVYNNVFPVTQAYQLHKIDLRNYSAGIYYVVLRDANGKKIKTGEALIR
jgi:hypothetical protein